MTQTGMDKKSSVRAVTGGAIEKAKFCLRKVRSFTQELGFRKVLLNNRLDISGQPINKRAGQPINKRHDTFMILKSGTAYTRGGSFLSSFQVFLSSLLRNGLRPGGFL